MKTLNQQIAEQVMAWTLLNYETMEPAKSDEDYNDASNNDGWTWQGADSGEEAWAFMPSSKISDAMNVVHHLNTQGYMVSMDVYEDLTAAVSILSSIKEGSGECKRFIAGTTAPNLPEAICKAALNLLSNTK